MDFSSLSSAHTSGDLRSKKTDEIVDGWMRIHPKIQTNASINAYLLDGRGRLVRRRRGVIIRKWTLDVRKWTLHGCGALLLVPPLL